MDIYINKPPLIALTGPVNSGKRAYVEYISTRLSCTHVISLSSFAVVEAKHSFGHVLKNKAEVREYMSIMRHMKGNDYFLKKLKLDEIINVSAVFIRSLKTPEEVKFIKSIGGVVVGITSNQYVRYQRSQSEDYLKGFSFEYFKQMEADEFPDLDKCFDLADEKIVNDELDFKRSPSSFYLGPCNKKLDELSKKFPYFDLDSGQYDPVFIDRVNKETIRSTSLF